MDIEGVREAGQRTCECCWRVFSANSVSPQPPQPRKDGKPGHCRYCDRRTTVYDQPKGNHNDVCHYCWAVYARLKEHPALRDADANRAEVARQILLREPPPLKEPQSNSFCLDCQKVLIAIQHHDYATIRSNPSARLLNGFSLVVSSRLGAEDAVASAETFIPDGIDRRELIERQIRARRGQQAFRNALRKRYGDCCVVTGCRILAILEAAHISPYRGDNDNHPANGLLLRADIHTLFDLNLIGVNPEQLQVELHPAIATEYGYLSGKALMSANNVRPSPEALKSRYAEFGKSVGAAE